jgi:hypothetical protein
MYLYHLSGTIQIEGGFVLNIYYSILIQMLYADPLCYQIAIELLADYNPFLISHPCPGRLYLAYDQQKVYFYKVNTILLGVEKALCD